MERFFRSKRLFLIPAVLLILFASGTYLVRDLWFDEALTVQNFAALPSWSTIYRSYVIPNNQLLYTMCLHSWISWTPGIFAPDDWMRILTFLFALALMAACFFGFRRSIGGVHLVIVLTAFVCSPVFLLHATALRGYMLGALFTVLALRTGLNFAADGKVRSWMLFFLCSLGSVAVLPSDLMALGGVLLYMLPCFGAHFYLSKRFYAAALAVPAVFGLFYLPIWHSFLQCARVGSNETWSDPAGVFQAVAVALMSIFVMLLLPAGIAGAGMLKRPHFNMLRTARAGIWLIPLFVVLILPKAPFPRVFFPLFPLYVLLVAALFRDISMRQIRLRRRYHAGCWYGGFFALILLWCVVMQNTTLKLAFSRRCGGAGRDDFFYSYPLRPDFMPRKSAQQLKEYLEKESLALPCYFSFQSDPWPLIFYLRLNGAPVADFLFDGPGGRVAELPRETLAVLHREESQTETAKRFPGNWVFVAENSNHKIWRVSR